MARSPLTWQQVIAPDFSGTALSQRTAADALNRAVTSVSGGLDKFKDWQTTTADNAGMTAALRFQNPDELRAALANGTLAPGLDMTRLSPAAITSIGQRPGQLIQQDTAAQNLATSRTQDPLRTTGLELTNRGRQLDNDFAAEANPIRITGLGLANDSTRAGTALTNVNILRGQIGVQRDRTQLDAGNFELGNRVTDRSTNDTATAIFGQIRGSGARTPAEARAFAETLLQGQSPAVQAAIRTQVDSTPGWEGAFSGRGDPEPSDGTPLPAVGSGPIERPTSILTGRNGQPVVLPANMYARNDARLGGPNSPVRQISDDNSRAASMARLREYDRNLPVAPVYANTPGVDGVFRGLAAPNGQLSGAPQPSGAPAENPAGLLTPGNIDLANRPTVRNADGSVSTVRSVGVNVDGREVLLPTVSDDGRILTTEQAVAEYRRTGRHLGQFSSPEASTAYAQNLHEAQAARYAPPAPVNQQDPNLTEQLRSFGFNPAPVPAEIAQLMNSGFRISPQQLQALQTQILGESLPARRQRLVNMGIPEAVLRGGRNNEGAAPVVRDLTANTDPSNTTFDPAVAAAQRRFRTPGASPAVSSSSSGVAGRSSNGSQDAPPPVAAENFNPTEIFSRATSAIRDNANRVAQLSIANPSVNLNPPGTIAAPGNGRAAAPAGGRGAAALAAAARPDNTTQIEESQASGDSEAAVLSAARSSPVFQGMSDARISDYLRQIRSQSARDGVPTISFQTALEIANNNTTTESRYNPINWFFGRGVTPNVDATRRAAENIRDGNTIMAVDAAARVRASAAQLVSAEQRAKDAAELLRAAMNPNANVNESILASRQAAYERAMRRLHALTTESAAR